MVHSTPIKVRGYHLDMYGHVNNARYLEFLEEARWRLFEDYFDVDYWQKRGLGFVAVNINIAYRRPALLDELLEVQSSLTKLGPKSGVLRQKVVLQGTDTIVADADVTFAIFQISTGRAQLIEGDIRAALHVFVPPSEE